jgi:hypothetical protein
MVEMRYEGVGLTLAALIIDGAVLSMVYVAIG